jgi:hypothetical protein
VRDYKQENKTAKSRGETGKGSSSGDATRHRARRKVEKKLGRKLPTSIHVDHKKKLKSGGTNASGNLATRPASENMSDNGHKPKKRLPTKRP